MKKGCNSQASKKNTRKKNEWWDKECKQLKKETVKALRMEEDQDQQK
jgi:hypothetical protein